jgi:hypothetical protein
MLVSFFLMIETLLLAYYDSCSNRAPCDSPHRTAAPTLRWRCLTSLAPSTTSRTASGRSPRRAAAAPAPAEPSAGAATCAVCIDAPVAAALRPCFHAAFCADCADIVVRAGMPCPICRAEVADSQRKFFP